MPLRRLGSAIAKLFHRGRADPAKDNSNRYRSGYSIPPKRNTEEWLGMMGRSPLLGVVNKIAEDTSFVDGTLKVMNREGVLEDLPRNHPFFDFWENPNPLPQFSKESLWSLHQIYLLLIGESFMVIEKDQYGFPMELWPVPPQWVTGTPSIGHPYYTIMTAAGSIGEIAVEDMFVEMKLDPLNPYGRGLGMAQAVADEIEIDEYASAFQKRFFYNDGTPSSVIAIEEADKDSIDRFEAEWNSEHRGVENSHKTAVVTGKVSFAKLSDNMKDMDMIQGRTFMRENVFMYFTTPKEIMGIMDNSNRATAESAEYIYASQRITTIMKTRQKAVNQQLVEYWGDHLKWEYDDVIPRNQEFNKQLAIEGYNSELLDQNEGRELIGHTPRAHGDVWKSSILFAYVKNDEDPTLISNSTMTGSPNDYYDLLSEETNPYTKEKRTKASTSSVDRRAMEVLERAQRQRERQAITALNKYFTEQRGSLLSELQSTGKQSKADGVNENSFKDLEVQLSEITAPAKRAEIIIGFVEKFHGWNQDETRIREILGNIWEQSYTESKDIMDRLYDLNNAYKPEAREIFKRMGGSKISEDITQTTKDRIIEIIDNGLLENNSLEDIAKQLDDCADLGSYRAELVAQQETGNALSASNYDTMERSGIRRHKWVTRGDGAVRDSHRRMNGEVVEIGERFSNGLLYPRDPQGSAKEVLRCRCLDLPVRER